jgi:hypothetical protein
MQSNTARAVAGGLIVAVAVILFVVLKGGGGDDSTTAKTTTSAQGGATTTSPEGATPAAGTKDSERVIVVKNGKPVGGVADLTYNQGDRIRFRVDSDVSDEVHVHGYDIAKDVQAGGSVSFDFEATIAGIFEAELESRKEQIAELTVNP